MLNGNCFWAIRILISHLGDARPPQAITQQTHRAIIIIVWLLTFLLCACLYHGCAFIGDIPSVSRFLPYSCCSRSSHSLSFYASFFRLVCTDFRFQLKSIVVVVLPSSRPRCVFFDALFLKWKTSPSVFHHLSAHDECLNFNLHRNLWLMDMCANFVVKWCIFYVYSGCVALCEL